MAYYTPNDHDRETLTADRYRARGKGGTGWLVIAGIVLAALVAMVAFGGGGTTSEPHPGGAGSEPVILQDSSEAAPLQGTAPVAPAE